MSSLKADFDELCERIRHGRELGHASFEPIYYLIFLPSQILAVKRQTPAWIAKLRWEGSEVTPTPEQDQADPASRLLHLPWADHGRGRTRPRSAGSRPEAAGGGRGASVRPLRRGARTRQHRPGREVPSGCQPGRHQQRPGPARPGRDGGRARHVWTPRRIWTDFGNSWRATTTSTALSKTSSVPSSARGRNGGGNGWKRSGPRTMKTPRRFPGRSRCRPR